MGTIKYYKAKATINGGVSITPHALGMRLNDKSTPCLEVNVVYLTPDGKQRNFSLSDVNVAFETITPGGSLVCISSESTEYIKILAPFDGRFSLIFPPECIDAIGSSKLAYFRFTTRDSVILSSGDFVYTVNKDVYSMPSVDPKILKSFNSDLDELKGDFAHVQNQAMSAVQKAGEAREMAEKALKSIGQHLVDPLPHIFSDPNGTVYKYGFAVNETGGVSFMYEEAPK